MGKYQIPNIKVPKIWLSGKVETSNCETWVIRRNNRGEVTCVPISPTSRVLTGSPRSTSWFTEQTSQLSNDGEGSLGVLNREVKYQKGTHTIFTGTMWVVPTLLCHKSLQSEEKTLRDIRETYNIQCKTLIVERPLFLGCFTTYIRSDIHLMKKTVSKLVEIGFSQNTLYRILTNLL